MEAPSSHELFNTTFGAFIQDHSNHPFNESTWGSLLKSNGVTGNEQTVMTEWNIGFNDSYISNNETLSQNSWEEAFRDSSRFWVQRVLVPIVVIIGVLGNAVTIYILTRRPMRSSTNV